MNLEREINSGLDKADWGNEPLNIDGFVGREQELADLKRWILEEECQLVSLVATFGFGKSFLAKRISDELLPHFSRLCWRELKNLQTLSQEILPSLIWSLSGQQRTYRGGNLDEGLAVLLKILQEQRCLIISVSPI